MFRNGVLTYSVTTELFCLVLVYIQHILYDANLPLKPSWLRSPNGAREVPNRLKAWRPRRWDWLGSSSRGPLCRYTYTFPNSSRRPLVPRCMNSGAPTTRSSRLEFWAKSKLWSFILSPWRQQEDPVPSTTPPYISIKRQRSPWLTSDAPQSFCSGSRSDRNHSV